MGNPSSACLLLWMLLPRPTLPLLHLWGPHRLSPFLSPSDRHSPLPTGPSLQKSSIRLDFSRHCPGPEDLSMLKLSNACQLVCPLFWAGTSKPLIYLIEKELQRGRKHLELVSWASRTQQGNWPSEAAQLSRLAGSLKVRRQGLKRSNWRMTPRLQETHPRHKVHRASWGWSFPPGPQAKLQGKWRLVFDSLPDTQLSTALPQSLVLSPHSTFCLPNPFKTCLPQLLGPRSLLDHSTILFSSQS